MPRENDGRANGRSVYEILFSVNVAFAAMVGLFGQGPEALTSWLYRLNSSMRNSFRLEQTDLATNGFVFFIFALVLTLLMWALLRLSAGAWPTAKILPLVSGIAAIDAIPLVWSYGHRPWVAHGWYLPEVIQLVEAGLVVLCLYLFMRRRWQVPIWTCITILVIHFAFWFRAFGLFDGFESAFRYRRLRMSDLLIPHGVPAASIIALGSALIWLYCVTRSRVTVASS